MKILRILAVAFGALAVLPNSITTGYNSSTHLYYGLDLQVEPYGATGVRLSWENSEEDGILGYDILRRDDSGRYATIALVPAYATGLLSTYRYIDEPPADGTYSYRLRVRFAGRHSPDVYSYAREIAMSSARHLSSGPERPQL